MLEAFDFKGIPADSTVNAEVTHAAVLQIANGQPPILSEMGNMALHGLLNNPFAFAHEGVIGHDPELAWHLGVSAGETDVVLHSIVDISVLRPRVIEEIAENYRGSILAKEMLKREPALLQRLDPEAASAFWQLTEISEQQRPINPHGARFEKAIRIINLMRYSSYVPQEVIDGVKETEAHVDMHGIGDPMPEIITFVNGNAQAEFGTFDDHEEERAQLGLSICLDSFLTKHSGDPAYERKLNSRIENLLPLISGWEGVESGLETVAQLDSMGLLTAQHLPIIDRSVAAAAALPFEDVPIDQLTRVIDLAHDTAVLQGYDGIQQFLQRAKDKIKSIAELYAVVEDPSLYDPLGGSSEDSDTIHQKIVSQARADMAKQHVLRLARKLSGEETAGAPTLQQVVSGIETEFSEDSLAAATRFYSLQLDPEQRKSVHDAIDAALQNALANLPDDHNLRLMPDRFHTAIVRRLARFESGQQFLGDATARYVDSLNKHLDDPGIWLEKQESPSRSVSIAVDHLHNLLWFNPDYFTTDEGSLLFHEIQTVIQSALIFALDNYRNSKQDSAFIGAVYLSSMDFAEYIRDRALFRTQLGTNEDPIYETLLRQSFPHYYIDNSSKVINEQ